jgi:hypothetical protein
MADSIFIARGLIKTYGEDFADKQGLHSNVPKKLAQREKIP